MSLPGVVFCQESLGLFVDDVCDDVFPVASLEALAHFVVFEFDAFDSQEFCLPPCWNPGTWVS